MKRLSGRFTTRRLIALAGAGALLSAGLGVASAAASAADRTSGAVGSTRATSLSLTPCAIKSVAGDLYIGAGDAVYKVSQQTGAATSVPPGYSFGDACGVAVDGAGNVVVADLNEVVVVAAKTGTFYGKKMVKGHVYPIAADFSNGNMGAIDVQLDPSGNVVFDSNGAPASTTNAEYDSQIFVLAERAGTFYGKRMVKGKLYVIAGVRNGAESPPCDAPDAAAAHAAALAAGTKAAQANLGYTIGTLRFDAAGNIILADSGGDDGSPCGTNAYDVPPQVDVLPARTGTYYGQKMTVGDIYPIAGLGTKIGNRVPAVDSKFDSVSAVAIDHAGNLLVAALNDDYPLGGIRVIAAKTGTFYGQKMIKGDIYALPGLEYANAVAVDSAGNVLIGEADLSVVRLLAEKMGEYYGVKARAGHVYTIAGDGKAPV